MFGGLRLHYRGEVVTAVNTNRLQALFAYLAMHMGVLHSREHLASLFWPESTEAQARTNLRQLLHHLRSALPDGGGFINADSHNILWRSGPEFTIDVADFQHAAAQFAKAGDCAASKKQLEEAVALYVGDFMPGLYDEWAEGERKGLRQKLSEVLGELVSMLEQAGDFTAAILHSERRLALDPFLETSYQRLMHLHALNGDRAGALRVYHQCETTLRRELNAAPGAVTRGLRDQLMKQDAVAAASAAGAPTESAAGRLPLIGRQAEFDQLLRIWKEAERGRASFALITGESGIGKSRLLEELVIWVSRRGAAAAYARCYAAEGSLPYAPIADWIRTPAVRPVLSRLPEAQRTELVRVLPELLVEHPELGVPPPLNEGWRRRHFFDALARAVLSAPQPLLLVIDDLQWCDQETMEWLHYLLRFEPASRLLVAGGARAEELAGHRFLQSLMRELNRENRLTEIPLTFLSSTDTGFLASQASHKRLAPELISQLYDETRGNPLFVIETVRAGMASSDRSFSIQNDSAPAANSIPPKVHAVLSARLAQLSRSAQDLAALAACIGRAFKAELVAKAGHYDEDVLVSLLDELWQRRILGMQGDDSYDFSHDKLREVAYAALSPARRQLYHRRIAEGIAALHSDQVDVSAELARHYEQASLPARAAPLYHEAAKASRRRYAEAEAIGYLNRALSLLESLPPGAEHDRSELELLAELGISLSATSGYAAPEVGKVYARARMLCECSVGENKHYFNVLWGSWVFHVVRADLRVALEMARRLLQIADDDSLLGAAAHFAAGCTYFHLGEFTQSIGYFEQAMTRDETSGQGLHLTTFGPELGVFCRSYMAQLLWLLGDADRSAQYGRLALERAERIAHPFSIALALDYASMLHQFRGEPALAAERASQSEILCRQHGFRYYLAWTAIIRGWALAETGDAEKGLREIQQGLESLEQQGAALRGPYYRALMGQAFARAGDADRALRCVTDALRMRETTGECWSDGVIHELRSELLKSSSRAGHTQARPNRRRL